jgi:outer membrane protein assembly factor BamB
VGGVKFTRPSFVSDSVPVNSMNSKTILAASCLALTISSQAAPKDWPQWRGPNRDGVSSEKGLLKEWPSDGPPLAWRIKGVGGGLSSVVIAHGLIYTQGTRNKGNGGVWVTALDARNGEERWSEFAYNGNGPTAAPTVAGNRLYAVGTSGDLVCMDALTGKVIWKKSYATDFPGSPKPQWGFSESPLVDGDRLICIPGSPEAGIVALNKANGEVIWKSAVRHQGGGHAGAGYTGVVISHGAGVKQYITLMGHGLVGVRASDGQFLWGYKRVANGTASIPTPIVRGDHVFASSGYGTGAALLKIEKDGAGVKATEVYFLPGDKVQNHHGGMVLIGDHVYLGSGHNNGLPTCIEFLTGKVVWGPERGPGSASAAIVAADGHLYFRFENGIMGLIEASPTGYNLKGSFKLASITGQSWPHPVVCDGKLYIRDQDNLLCYDVRAK